MKLPFETSFGINLEEAYVKIENTNGNSEQQQVIIFIYANESARISKKNPVDQKDYTFQCSVEEGAPNFIKQGYDYLKTLPEFTAAIDV